MRFFLEIQYDGTHYHGWQKQPNAITIQEVLDNALSKLLRENIETVASGRTDAGVHCRQQFVHFDTENLSVIPNLQYKLNSFLPHDISISNIYRVNENAHARFDATYRAYRYYVHRQKSPFFHPVSYYYHKDLSVDRMNTAASVLLEYQNFAAFSKTNTDVKTFNCTIEEAHWQLLENGQLMFYIKANRFLRGMVRLITGTLLDIGNGKMSIDTLHEWLAQEQHVLHKHSAPAKGLYLSEVGYPEGFFE